jgi:DNA-binding MltR family transcriptional regulator
MAARIIPQIEQLSSESHQLLNVLNSSQDLSVILVGTSFLDTCLSSILGRTFIQSSVSKKLLDSRRGVLGTFAVRADTCYVLGLIKKPLYKDLLKIAEIRNEIAHYHLELGFDSETVKKLCGELSYVWSLKQGSTDQPLGLAELMVGARNQFVLSVMMISTRLLLIGLGIKGDSPTTKNRDIDL